MGHVGINRCNSSKIYSWQYCAWVNLLGFDHWIMQVIDKLYKHFFLEKEKRLVSFPLATMVKLTTNI